MKKTQQERLEKRILNLINKDLKFLEKKVVEKIIQIESSFLHHYKQHQVHT